MQTFLSFLLKQGTQHGRNIYVIYNSCICTLAAFADASHKDIAITDNPLCLLHIHFMMRPTVLMWAEATHDFSRNQITGHFKLRIVVQRLFGIRF